MPTTRWQRGTWTSEAVRTGMRSPLCRGQVTRQPREDGKKEGEETMRRGGGPVAGLPAATQPPQRCLRNCKPRFQRRTQTSHQRGTSRLHRLKRTGPRASSPRPSWLGLIPATESKHEKGARGFHRLPSAHWPGRWDRQRYLCSVGVLLFLPTNLFLLMTEAFFLKPRIVFQYLFKHF